jgi:predicted AlkP superfamily pyrophosphatase or phosphodiesterase
MRVVRVAVALVVFTLFATHAVAQSQAPMKKTLIIGIDGCRPDAMLAADAPYMRALIKDGAFSDKAQACDRTISGPCWGNILTGVWYQKHGVRDNSFQGTNFDQYPTCLARYKQARPDGYVASVAQWSGIDQIITGADFSATPRTGAATAATACQVLGEKDPDIVFVHFDDVDAAGHAFDYGPDSPKCLEAIGKIDTLVGKMLAAVESRKNYEDEDWLIVVVSDHGGFDKGHGQDNPECRTTFVILNGKSVAKGTIEPAPDQIDVAPTVLAHMGVPIDPAWNLDGKPIGLKAEQSQD